MFSEFDTQAMHQALTLAQQGMFTTMPNPRAGCVLVRQGSYIGQGSTEPPGGHHAEVQALNDARARGHDPRGATAYITLEPCCHFGRTPPCTHALIAAGVARVIMAIEDPNPLVSGKGMAQLRAAQIEVQCGLLSQQARDLNIGLISRMTRGRPWVRLKAATSLDGCIALPNGQSQWISSLAAQTDGHAWRARASAILTGMGTVRQDNPQCTARHIDTPHQPQRILIDRNLEIPLTARLLTGAPLWIVCALEDLLKSKKAADLRSRGARIIALPAPDHLDPASSKSDLRPTDRRVDFQALLKLLGNHEFNELHIEAGSQLNSAWLQSGCVDELLIYLAPCLLGKGIRLFDFDAPATLAQRPQFSFHSIENFDNTLRILARMEPALPESRNDKNAF